MAYLSETALQAMGFKSLGRNVKISEKASVYDTDHITIGNNSRIDDFCVLSGKITIGSHVHIAPFCLVAGGTEGIQLLDFAGLAYGVQVFTQSDDYTGRTLTNPTVPDEFKLETKRAVVIGRHVIVGASSLVFPGVILAEGCSVGAMSLVRKSTDPWGVYIGNPAKRMKERKKDLLELEKRLLENDD